MVWSCRDSVSSTKRSGDGHRGPGVGLGVVRDQASVAGDPRVYIRIGRIPGIRNGLELPGFGIEQKEMGVLGGYAGGDDGRSSVGGEGENARVRLKIDDVDHGAGLGGVGDG